MSAAQREVVQGHVALWESSIDVYNRNQILFPAERYRREMGAHGKCECDNHQFGAISVDGSDLVWVDHDPEADWFDDD